MEAGIALDARGVDLNRAFAELRPALRATDDVMRELGSQNAALKSLVTDAQRVTGQAAPRSRDLGRLVSSLSSLVRATDARRPALDKGVAQLPATLGRVRSTADELAKTARAARAAGGVAARLGPGADHGRAEAHAVPRPGADGRQAGDADARARLRLPAGGRPDVQRAGHRADAPRRGGAEPRPA